MRDSNVVTRQGGVAMDRRDRFILFCDEDTPLQRLRGVYLPEDCGTSLGDTAGNVGEDDGFRAGGPNANDPNGNQRERVVRDNLNIFKSPSYAPGGTPGRDANAKKRKSVSFEDDVIVFLFDQESPTWELRPDSSVDGASEDAGLEWEDDFSALEKQQASPPGGAPRGAALPRRFSLSQTCLFLTHVSESDLEL